MAGKRKRESMDQGGPVAPPPPSNDFRASPSAGPLDFDPSQYVHHHESDMPPHFADALVQHNAGEHSLHHGDSSNGQSATDTANAALHYSMTVQDTTDDGFLQQAAVDAQREPSNPLNFGESTHAPQNPYEFTHIEQLKEPTQQQEPSQQPNQQPPQQQTPSVGPDQSPPVGGTTPNANKPAVGTDEWHKVRRDNHKEGECTLPQHKLFSLLTFVCENSRTSSP